MIRPGQAEPSFSKSVFPQAALLKAWLAVIQPDWLAQLCPGPEAHDQYQRGLALGAERLMGKLKVGSPGSSHARMTLLLSALVGGCLDQLHQRRQAIELLRGQFKANQQGNRE